MGYGWVGDKEDSIGEGSRHFLDLHGLCCDLVVAPNGHSECMYDSEQLLGECRSFVASARSRFGERWTRAIDIRAANQVTVKPCDAPPKLAG